MSLSTACHVTVSHPQGRHIAKSSWTWCSGAAADTGRGRLQIHADRNMQTDVAAGVVQHDHVHASLQSSCQSKRGRGTQMHQDKMQSSFSWVNKHLVPAHFSTCFRGNLHITQSHAPVKSSMCNTYKQLK